MRYSLALCALLRAGNCFWTRCTNDGCPWRWFSCSICISIRAQAYFGAYERSYSRSLSCEVRYPAIFQVNPKRAHGSCSYIAEWERGLCSDLGPCGVVLSGSRGSSWLSLVHWSRMTSVLTWSRKPLEADIRLRLSKIDLRLVSILQGSFAAIPRSSEWPAGLTWWTSTRWPMTLVTLYWKS